MRRMHAGFALGWPLGLALLLALAPAALAAQTIRGTVTGADSGQPAAAAFVVLEDSTGTRGGSLTDAAGRYAVRAPAPGRYRLRIERLALETHTTAWLQVGAEGIQHDISVPERPIALTGITVAGQRSGCRTSAELGADAARLWEEARKALSLADWAARTQRLTYSIQRGLLERRAGSTRIMLQIDDDAVRETSGTPWSSAPVDELLSLGFVRVARTGSHYYYGPDAATLLSPAFLASHCFEIATHATDPALIGLRFRPRERPRVTDIAGVLWLRRADAELREIEFRYENLPYRIADTVGGTVSFRRLPAGLWITDGWTIRAPRSAAPAPGAQRGELIMSEQSARVVGARDMAGVLVFGSADAVRGAAPVDDIPIEGGFIPARFLAAQRCGKAPDVERAHALGRVFDSRGTPVGGAKIIVRTTDDAALLEYTTESDEDGFYRICDVPAQRPLDIEARAAGLRSEKTSYPRLTSDVLRRDFFLQPEGTR